MTYKTYNEDDLKPLSALQHLLFCERQCALIHIEQAWSENLFTAEGRIMHDRVDTANLFDERKIGPDFCTEALLREIREKNTGMASDNLIVLAENRANYPSVDKLFQVIEDNEMFTVIVDEGVKVRLENGEKPTRRELQTLTVRMRKDQIETLRLPRIGRYEELYFCYPDYYNEFLGYMRGILQTISVLQEGSII